MTDPLTEAVARDSETVAERAERVGRGIELEAVAVYLERWADGGPPGWRNAARCFAIHIRNGAHRAMIAAAEAERK